MRKVEKYCFFNYNAQNNIKNVVVCRFEKDCVDNKNLFILKTLSSFVIIKSDSVGKGRSNVKQRDEGHVTPMDS